MSIRGNAWLTFSRPYSHTAGHNDRAAMMRGIMTYFLLSNVEQALVNPDPLRGVVANRLGLSADQIRDVVILREALDARRKTHIHHVLTLAVRLADDSIPGGFKPHVFPQLDWTSGTLQPAERPIIVGLGPAGLFCALTLVRMGHRPLILEQGKHALNTAH